MSIRRIISIIVFFLYLAAVAYLCFAKLEDVPQIDSTWFGLPTDKVVHMIMFAPFPPLAYLVFEPTGRKIIWKALLILAIIATGIGLAFLTEDIQSKLTYRTYDSKDIIADLLGISAGTIATVFYMLFRK